MTFTKEEIAEWKNILIDKLDYTELKDKTDDEIQQFLFSLSELIVYSEWDIIETIPDSIGKLHNLQHLNIVNPSHPRFRTTQIKSIPESIGQLYNLETLEIQYISDLETLPESIG